jgi:hypothetical protein
MEPNVDRALWRSVGGEGKTGDERKHRGAVISWRICAREGGCTGKRVGHEEEDAWQEAMRCRSTLTTSGSSSGLAAIGHRGGLSVAKGTAVGPLDGGALNLR